MNGASAIDSLAGERVPLEGKEPDIRDQSDTSELSAPLEGLEEKDEEVDSAVQEIQHHLNKLGPRIEVAERGLGGIEAIQAKIGKQREALTGIRSDVDILRSVVVSLCRLVWGIDQDHIKNHRGGDQWANQPAAEKVEEAREALRSVLGIYPASVERALAAIQRKSEEFDDLLRGMMG